MARYAFTYTENGVCELYAESTSEEEKLDIVDGKVAIDFTGNGYLAFWKRCKEMIREFEDIPSTEKTGMSRESSRTWITAPARS